MSRILILSSYYLGTATANGICAQNIVNELNNIGHNTDVICYADAIYLHNSTNIHTIESEPIAAMGKTLRIANRVRKAVQLFMGSIGAALDTSLVKKYYYELEKINSKEKLDAVVAMYFPLESAEALRLFKKAHPNVKAILYELDSVGDGVAKTNMQTLYNRMYEKWLTKVYNTIDNIFVMQSHEKYWRTIFGGQFLDKLRIADIPVLTSKPFEVHNKDNVSMIYAGLIEKQYRSPSYLLSVLSELNKSMEYTFDFYSKGDCENEIAEIAKEVNGISQNGYVPQDELDKAIINSDFLISIGNSVSRSVPSKIITYLSYGKPIIHFSSQKNDVCNEYFKKYPLALVVDQSLQIEEAIKLIGDFILNAKGKMLEFADVEEVFYLNTPSYTVGIISSVLD